ncbi:MAG: hypothetical protein IKX50_09735 [Spirochaetia bacterium]|nr:hypothetical protein [Spirochaetia bacterium]MBR5017986.1 hypothetical protein [Spirochaetia bacterium]
MKNRYENIIDYNWKGSPGRVRMPLEQRAKIFAPFAALRGYSELLRKAEEEALQRFERDKNEYENPDVNC